MIDAAVDLNGHLPGFLKWFVVLVIALSSVLIVAVISNQDAAVEKTFLLETFRTSLPETVGSSWLPRIVGSRAMSFEVAPREETLSMRLAWYASITRADPIFAIPGTDLVRFEQAVLRLEKLAFHFSLPIDDSRPGWIGRSLYPIHFLKQLIVSEQARRAFLSSPTLLSAGRYHSELLKTIFWYESDAGALSRAIDGFPNAEEYIVPVGSTSAEILIEALEQLSIGAQDARRKEGVRFQCLSRFSPECSSEKRGSDTAAFSESNVPSQVTLTPLTEDRLRLIKEYRRFDPDFRAFSETLVALQRSVCAPPLPAFVNGSLYLPWWKSADGEGISFHVEPFNELFLRTFEGGHGGLIDDLGSISPYAYQSLATIYLCPGIGSDLSRIRTALFVQDALRSLSFTEKIPDFPTALATDSTSPTILPVEYSEAFIRELWRAAEDEDNPWFIETLGLPLARELLELGVTGRLRSAASDELLGVAADFGEYALALERNGYPISSERLLVLYSSPSILFFPFNPSFISRAPEFFSPPPDSFEFLPPSLSLVPLGSVISTIESSEVPALLCRGREALRSVAGMEVGDCVTGK